MADGIQRAVGSFSNGNTSAHFLGCLTSTVAKAFVMAPVVMLFQILALSTIGAANIGLGTGPVIVAAFGTSLTYQSGWLKPLEEKLTRCLDRQVTVLDLGKDGQTSEGALKFVGQVIEAHPDVVLIEFSASDAAWFKGVSLKRSRENTARIVLAIVKALPEAKVFLMTMNPAWGPRSWIRLNLDAYYSLYESLANELGIGYIDHRPAWKALRENELRAGIPDGAHSLPELASRLLVPTISKAIAPGCTDSGS